MKVFITGGTTGIGAELAKIYCQQGASVGVCGRHREKFEKTFSPDPQIKFYPVDVAVREQLLTAIREFSSIGGLDLMVANAGMVGKVQQRYPDFRQARKIIEVNTLGVLAAFEGAMEFMAPARQGQLVAIASIAGFLGLPTAGAYCGSKAAVIQLCESLAIDLRPLGIHTCCICPGFVDTPLIQGNRHPMPFLMSAPQAAKKIYQAINQRKPLTIFPWPMKVVSLLLRTLPRSLYRYLMSQATVSKQE